MNFSGYNQRMIASLRDAFECFVAGELDVDGVQEKVQSIGRLLENDGTGVSELVRLAEADIEEIRFTRLLDEQRPAVVFRLDELLGRLPGGEP